MEESERAPEWSKLEERLGHVFRRPRLLAAALTHRSYAAETNPPGEMENQRLEFLGDAVLGAISADWLVAHRSDWREGTLTKVRSRLTHAVALARVARKLELGDFLRLGRGQNIGAIVAHVIGGVGKGVLPRRLQGAELVATYLQQLG